MPLPVTILFQSSTPLLLAELVGDASARELHELSKGLLRAQKKGLKQIEAQLREETRVMVLLRYRILIN